MEANELKWAHVFIAAQQWRFAKTMPQWPHWYIIRREGNRAADFDRLAALIEQFGEDDSWGRETRRYLRIRKFKYWAMGEVINRAAPLPSYEVRRRGALWLKRNRKTVGPYGNLALIDPSKASATVRKRKIFKGPYAALQQLVQAEHGGMTWLSGGSAGGGVWQIVLREGAIQIEVRTNRANALDRLYKANVRSPKTWDDFEDELLPDALARLKRLVERGIA